MVWEAVENGQGINRGNRTVFFHIHDQLLVRITSHYSIELYFSLLDRTSLLTLKLLSKNFLLLENVTIKMKVENLNGSIDNLGKSSNTENLPVSEEIPQKEVDGQEELLQDKCCFNTENQETSSEELIRSTTPEVIGQNLFKISILFDETRKKRSRSPTSTRRR